MTRPSLTAHAVPSVYPTGEDLRRHRPAVDHCEGGVMTEFTTSVREVQCEVRIDLTNAPKITNSIGQTRKPEGLRITYGRRRDIDRVDLVVEYRDSAEWMPPAGGLPDWVRELVLKHRPADVDQVDAIRPHGLGGMQIEVAS